MKGAHMFAWILLVIGGLNWLLIGVFDWGVVELVGESAARIIYILVGLSAVYELFSHRGNCRACMSGGKM